MHQQELLHTQPRSFVARSDEAFYSSDPQSSSESDPVISESGSTRNNSSIGGTTSRLILNRICQYNTTRRVLIKDVGLATLYLLVLSLVCGIFYYYSMFSLLTRQIRREGRGSVLMVATGKLFDAANDARVFDYHDFSSDFSERRGMFLPLEITSRIGQRVEECVNPLEKCPCTSPFVCDSNTLSCKGPRWCPVLASSSASSSTNKPAQKSLKIVKTKGIRDIELSLVPSISFISSQQHHSSFTYDGEANAFSKIGLKSLIERISPTGTNLDSRGMVIRVAFLWDCSLAAENTECSPHTVLVERADSPTKDLNPRIFFDADDVTQRKVREYVDLEGIKRRDITLTRGVRIIAESIGKSRETNGFLLVYAFCILLALLQLASIFCDFFMLNLYPKELQEVFSLSKFEQPQDYADLKTRIDLVKEDEDDNLPVRFHTPKARSQANLSTPRRLNPHLSHRQTTYLQALGRDE